MKNIYDLYKNNKFVGTYSARVIADKCGIDPCRISSLADSNSTFAGGYRCEVVDTIPNETERLAADWNNTRSKFLEVRKKRKNNKYFIQILDTKMCGNNFIRLLCKVLLDSNTIIYSVEDKTKKYFTTGDFREAEAYLKQFQ